MNNANFGPEFQLPNPQNNNAEAGTDNSPKNIVDTKAERSLMNPELSIPVRPQDPMPPMPQRTGQPHATPGLRPQGIGPSAPIASVEEVVDKRYVVSAKRIIADTRGNPYERKKALAKLSAEYIQNNYGKQIKVA